MKNVIDVLYPLLDTAFSAVMIQFVKLARKYAEVADHLDLSLSTRQGHQLDLVDLSLKSQ